MKLSEMNARQKKAYKNVYYAARDCIGGLENTISDNPVESEDHINAKASLGNHAGLVEMIYRMAITDIFDEGCVRFGKAAEAYMKDIRFCGKEWIMERVERQVTKLGY
jgi:hypothetical protein